MNLKLIFGIVVLLVVGFLIIALVSSPPASPASSQEKLLFSQYMIKSFDIDAKNQKLYFIAQKEQKDEALEFKTVIVGQYDLISKQKNIIDEQFPYTTEAWISVLKNGNVMILDDGDNAFGLSWEKKNEASLIEYSGSEKISTYKVLNRILEHNEQRDVQCNEIELLKKSTDRSFAGMVRTTKNTFIPRFALITNANGEKEAINLANCNPSQLDEMKNEFFDKNISVLEKNVFEETQGQSEYTWIDSAHNFKYASRRKTITFLESGCEKSYDEFEVNGKKYNMGFCIHGILGFSESGTLVLNKNVLYLKKDGIFAFEE